MTWYNSSWLKRKPVTIDQAQVDATLTDFPVMVDLANSDVLASARADMRDVLFTSSDGTTKLSHELVKRHFLGLGGWTWFTNPRAIYHNGTYERVYIGTIDGAGVLYVGQYDHTTGAYTHTSLTTGFQVDDHNNPSIFVRPSDSKLIALYTTHSTDTSLRWKVSTNAEDATSWGSEQTSTYSGNITYANPILLADDSNACYVFSRVNEGSGDHRWSYKRTVDFSTWGSEVEFWDTGAYYQYVHCVENGTGRIDFFASDRHPVDTGDSSLYHFYCEWVAGALVWYNSAGTSQTLPMDTSKATLVYSGAGALDGWNHQIAIDGSGYPRVLFQKTVSLTGTGDIRLMFARWNGSAWTTPVEVTALGGYVYAGEVTYTGCSCFDGVDIDKIYIGKEVSSRYEIQEWITTDTGATWTKSRDITTGSASGTQNLRPYSPKNHNGKLACLWGSGTYTSFTNFGLSTYCDPPLATEAYVKVPTVSGTVDTDIYCYYDNQAAADQEDASNAWDSGFMGVYHLEHKPSSLTILDSTSNARNGTKKSLSEPSGAIVGAQKFDGVNDYITLGTALNFAGLTEVTIEAVINHDGTGAANEEHTVFSCFSSTTVAATMLRIEPNTGGTANRLEGFAIKQTDTQVGGDFGITVTPSQINHVASAYNATDLRGYVNGTVGGTTFASGAAFDAGASPESLIGYTNANSTDGLTGNLYEVRISNVARSAAWLKATSVNLRTPTSFYTYGTEEDYTGTITADASITQAGNTSSGTAALTIIADSSISQSSNTSTASGAIVIAADCSITQDGNTLTSTASLVADTITADASITQASNTSAAHGSLSIVADAAVTQSGNTLTSTAALASDTITANADITQASNTATADGVISIAAGVSITQDGNSITFNAALVLAVEASITQAGNTLTSSAGSNAWAGEPFNFASPITMTFNFDSPI